ncbi:hypothetical protein K6L44_16770 [Gluconacetobacter entanii]|uniref:hypothetical protein n=1 Tax=Gluconacetobacter entanii TaxID=108528 RepID=UPI001C935424|nr:hypothetical protein [Gluconacetobacter entanii]MBY4641605.1 hypothetical protein [Gluconacetobacter entanii]MCW4579361.1 hypothetical protein [Gluconacetobacter entanii]MCW4582759.1 hypothetical protein [Gluconacetobacter entanii]MCW4586173.1 hypothetical protein [Gluconacetobacter entanii]
MAKHSCEWQGTGVNRIGVRKWRYVLACLMFQVGLLLSALPVHAFPTLDAGSAAAPPAVSHDMMPGMASMAGMTSTMEAHGHTRQCHHQQPCDTHQNCAHGSESCCLSGAACMTGWAMTPGASSLAHAGFVTIAFGSRYTIDDGGVASAPALPPPRKTA